MNEFCPNGTRGTPCFFLTLLYCEVFRGIYLIPAPVSGPVWKPRRFCLPRMERDAARLHRRHTEEVNDARRALFRQRRQAERRQGRDWLTFIFLSRARRRRVHGYVSGVVLTPGRTDGMECAWSGAAPAEGCERVRGTAGAGTDARGGPRDAGAMRGVFLFVNLRVGSVRYSSDRRVRRVRGWMPAGEARNPGKRGWGAARRGEEGRVAGRGFGCGDGRRRTAMRTR
jgi:hypothetical protein